MPPRSHVALALSLASAACGSNEAAFTSKFASGFSHERHVVSVFGVYKDGQMSAEAWDSLAPRLSAALGGAKCDVGYVDPPLARDNGPLWTAVDDYTRSNGPTDDLLGELAPAAQGDLVLVLTYAGKVPAEEKTRLPSEGSSPAMSGGGGRGMGGGMGGGMGSGMHSQGVMSRGHATPAGSKDALDLAALLYSVQDKRSVGQVSLEYTGHSLELALDEFTAHLRQALPAASCAGWTWDGKVDVERVRTLGE